MFSRSLLTVIVAWAFLLARPSLGQEPQKTDDDPSRQLAGVWIAERVLSSGEEIAQEKFPFELHFEDRKLTFKFVGATKGKDRLHELTLDASKEPHEMDILRTLGDQKIMVYAIYKLEDDRLSICFLRDAKGQPSKERPTAFDSSPTVRSDLLILKRKPESPADNGESR